jgi:putative superfamily III holin-X
MADHVSVQSNGSTGGSVREQSPPRVVAHNLSELLHDSLTLGDLQLRLLWADCRRLAADVIYPGVLLLVAVVLVLSCVPVALATIALTLVETTRLTMAQSFAFTLAGGLVLGGIGALAALVWLRRYLDPFARSLAELDANVRWIKKILRENSSTRKSADRRPAA